MSQITEVKLGGTAYVILPKADYLRLRAGETPPGSVDALEYAAHAIGEDLRRAREHAKLTQVELAAKLDKSQVTVSAAESGRMRVGEKYVLAVLKACGLPKDWKPAKRDKKA